MADLTVSADIDAFLAAANKTAAQTALGMRFNRIDMYGENNFAVTNNPLGMASLEFRTEDAGNGFDPLVILANAEEGFSVAQSGYGIMVGGSALNFNLAGNVVNATLYGIYFTNLANAQAARNYVGLGAEDTVEFGVLRLFDATNAEPGTILLEDGSYYFRDYLGNEVLRFEFNGDGQLTGNLKTTRGLSAWNAIPLGARPTTAYAASTFAANTSGITNGTATYDGYTVGQIVKVLRDMGFLT